jgi:hypothetical protein
MVLYARGNEVKQTPNQVFAGPEGQPVRISFVGQKTAKRKHKEIDGVEYYFDVTLGDEDSQHVGVVVSSDAERAIARWLEDPKNYGNSEPGPVTELTALLSMARILEGVSRNIDFKADVRAYPESFIKIFGADFEDLIKPRKTANLVIREYIIRRLYAAWKVGGESIDYAQLFDRPDMFFLRITYEDMRRVMDLYRKGPEPLWKMEADDEPLLRATPELILRLEREAEEAVSMPATSAPAATEPGPRLAVDEPRVLMYDVALSYAGEDRAYVEKVAGILKSKRVRVFYDKYEQVTLWGKDNYDHLADVFENRAHFVVMFISKHYAEKVWPNHERKAAQARAVRERREYILPVRFDDTKLPGLSGNVGYIDLRTMTPEQLADLTLEKLVQDLVG